MSKKNLQRVFFGFRKTDSIASFVFLFFGMKKQFLLVLYFSLENKNFAEAVSPSLESLDWEKVLD